VTFNRSVVVIAVTLEGYVLKLLVRVVDLGVQGFTALCHEHKVHTVAHVALKKSIAVIYCFTLAVVSFEACWAILNGLAGN